MVNRVVLVGRLTRDPELRKTPTGVSVASFTLAVDNTRKNPDGTRGTCFLNCTVFREQGENLVKFCRKGSLVGVDGSLNQRNFVRQDGTKCRSRIRRYNRIATPPSRGCSRPSPPSRPNS